jgi:hypothetical protein
MIQPMRVDFYGEQADYIIWRQTEKENREESKPTSFASLNLFTSIKIIIPLAKDSSLLVSSMVWMFVRGV